MARPPSLTVLDVKRMARMRAAGRTTDEIAADLGVSRQTVLRWCKRLRIPSRDGRGRNLRGKRSRWRSPAAETLYRMLYWDRGMTLAEIASRSGLSESVIQKRFVVLGIGRRKPGPASASQARR